MKNLKKGKLNYIEKIKLFLIYIGLIEIIYMIILIALLNLNLLYYYNFILYDII